MTQNLCTLVRSLVVMSLVGHREEVERLSLLSILDRTEIDMPEIAGSSGAARPIGYLCNRTWGTLHYGVAVSQQAPFTTKFTPTLPLPLSVEWVGRKAGDSGSNSLRLECKEGVG